MKSALFFTVTFLASTLTTYGQTIISPNPENWTAHNCEVSLKGDILYVKSKGGPSVLWLKDFNLQKGTIELDIKGDALTAQNYVGLAFHGVDDEQYDAVYFRPFNFTNPEKKMNAVQYIDHPDKVWHVLRKAFPGKYENAARPAPNPYDWFHAKYVIDFPEIKVYLNGADEPTLTVEQTSQRADGKIGLWVDVNDGWFKNITIHKCN